MKTNAINRIAISMALVMSVATMGFAQRNSHAQGRTQNSSNRESTSTEQNTRNSRRQEVNAPSNSNVASGQNNRYNNGNSNKNEQSNNKGQNNGNHYGQNKEQNYEGNSNHYGNNNQEDHYKGGKSGYDDRGNGHHQERDYTYEPQRNNDYHSHDNYRDNHADYGHHHNAPAYCHRLPGKSYNQYDFSGVRYYHCDGRFYKYSRDGYYVVDCPYIVVNVLPLHYSIRYYNGYRLAFHHGHYFIPVERGWMMVPEPEAPQFSMNINIGF